MPAIDFRARLEPGDVNLVQVEPADAGVAVTVCGARLIGTPVAPVAGDAVVAIRPEDMLPSADGPVTATVEIAEYHGRDFYAVARGADGTELYFRSDRRIAPGERVNLTAAPSRVLVYPA